MKIRGYFITKLKIFLGVPIVLTTHYRSGANKILVISRIKGKHVSMQKYLVEHLLDQNENVTQEMLNKEDELFT